MRPFNLGGLAAARSIPVAIITGNQTFRLTSAAFEGGANITLNDPFLVARPSWKFTQYGIAARLPNIIAVLGPTISTGPNTTVNQDYGLGVFISNDNGLNWTKKEILDIVGGDWDNVFGPTSSGTYTYEIEQVKIFDQGEFLQLQFNGERFHNGSPDLVRNVSIKTYDGGTTWVGQVLINYAESIRTPIGQDCITVEPAATRVVTPSNGSLTVVPDIVQIRDLASSIVSASLNTADIIPPAYWYDVRATGATLVTVYIDQLYAGKNKLLMGIGIRPVNGTGYVRYLWFTSDKNLTNIQPFTFDPIMASFFTGYLPADNPGFHTNPANFYGTDQASGYAGQSFGVWTNPDTDTMILQYGYRRTVSGSYVWQYKMLRSTDFGLTWNDVTPAGFVPFRAYFEMPSPSNPAVILGYWQRTGLLKTNASALRKNVWVVSYTGSADYVYVSYNDGLTWKLVLTTATSGKFIVPCAQLNWNAHEPTALIPPANA